MLRVARGEELRLPFLLTTRRSAAPRIVNLSAGQISARLLNAAGALATLGVIAGPVSGRLSGSGIIVVNPIPPPAATGQEQQPHGLIVLDEAITRQLDLGERNEIVLIFTTAWGVTLQARRFTVDGMPS